MSKNTIIEFWLTGENPITCYQSRKNHQVLVKIPQSRTPKHKTKGCRKPVIVIDNLGYTTRYESIVLAVAATGISPNSIYALLNGRPSKVIGYQIYKA